MITLFWIHLLHHSLEYYLYLPFSCFSHRLEFDSDESLDDEEAEKERSLGDVASPVEQTEGKSSPCSPRNKKYLASISKDSPTVLDVENANIDQPSATDTDDTAMKKDCSEDNQLGEKAGNEKEVKQIASTLDDVRNIPFFF